MVLLILMQQAAPECDSLLSPAVEEAAQDVHRLPRRNMLRVQFFSNLQWISHAESCDDSSNDAVSYRLVSSEAR